MESSNGRERIWEELRDEVGYSIGRASTPKASAVTRSLSFVARWSNRYADLRMRVRLRETPNFRPDTNEVLEGENDRNWFNEERREDKCNPEDGVREAVSMTG